MQKATLGLIQSTFSVKSFWEAFSGGNSMIVIIIILFILAAGTSVGIKFLRRRKNSAKNGTTLKTDEIQAQVNNQEGETVPKHQKLEKYYEDDDISTLAETLARLASEYEETYKKLRQIIANKYKQLQEVSQYINEQTEKLNQLAGNNEDIFKDEIQAKYAEVHKLAEQGIDRIEIAQRTKLPVGEIDLLLSLSNPSEE